MNLEEMHSCFDVPAAHGPEILAILTEIDPIPGEDKRYTERVEKFCQKFVLRHVTDGISLEFLNIAAERMFTIDEICDVIPPRILHRIQFEICSLFF